MTVVQRAWSGRVFVLIGICVVLGVATCAQTSGSQDSDKSWTTTSESRTPGTNPTRTLESHKEAGNRTIDTRSVQRLGVDGRYEPYLDVETETVHVDANTETTITRSYVRDADGRKTLRQVTEEQKHTLPGGGSSVTRATSNPDADGRLQLVQREIEETKKTSETTEEVKKTVLLPSVNGGLSPSMKVDERRVKGADGAVQTQSTTSLVDGSGNWQAGEVRNTTEQKGTKEERVSRPDNTGRMNEVSRRVTRQTENATGEKRSTVEDYSVNVPGTVGDGGLHLVQRATTQEQTSTSGGRTMQQQVEQVNPGDPSSGLRVTVVSAGSLQPGAGGTQGAQTVQMRDANGNFGTVSVDLLQSTKTHVVEIPAPAGAKNPAEKPPGDKKGSGEQKPGEPK